MLTWEIYHFFLSSLADIVAYAVYVLNPVKTRFLIRKFQIRQNSSIAFQSIRYKSWMEILYVSYKYVFKFMGNMSHNEYWLKALTVFFSMKKLHTFFHMKVILTIFSKSSTFNRFLIREFVFITNIKVRRAIFKKKSCINFCLLLLNEKFMHALFKII